MSQEEPLGGVTDEVQRPIADTTDSTNTDTLLQSCVESTPTSDTPQELGTSTAVESSVVSEKPHLTPSNSSTSVLDSLESAIPGSDTHTEPDPTPLDTDAHTSQSNSHYERIPSPPSTTPLRPHTQDDTTAATVNTSHYERIPSQLAPQSSHPTPQPEVTQPTETIHQQPKLPRTSYSAIPQSLPPPAPSESNHSISTDATSGHYGTIPAPPSVSDSNPPATSALTTIVSQTESQQQHEGGDSTAWKKAARPSKTHPNKANLFSSRGHVNTPSVVVEGESILKGMLGKNNNNNNNNSTSPTNSHISNNNNNNLQLPKTSSGRTSPTNISPTSSRIEGKPLTDLLSDTKVILRGEKERYQIVNNERKVLSLEDELRLVLDDTKTVKLFKEFLDQEFCSEALLFWLEIEVFKKQQADGALPNVLAFAEHAKAIYEKYFLEESHFQLNIDADIKRLTEERMATPTAGMFKEAQEYMFELMKTDSFRRFRNCQMYLAYLADQEVKMLTEKLEEAAVKERAEERQRDRLKILDREKELNNRVVYEGDPPADSVHLSATLLSSILSIYKRHCDVIKQMQQSAGIHASTDNSNNNNNNNSNSTKESGREGGKENGKEGGGHAKASKIKSHKHTSHIDLQQLQEVDDSLYLLKCVEGDEQYKEFSNLTSQLQKVPLLSLSNKERLVFFVNTYNCLCLHAVVELEGGAATSHSLSHSSSLIASSSEQKAGFLRKARYKIGGYTFSLADIEFGVLRAQMTKSHFGSKLKVKFGKSDPRSQFVLTEGEPLLNFVLYSSSKSSPLISVYSLENFTEKAVANAKEYMASEVEVDGAKNKVRLPKLLSWYTKDFSMTGSERDMLSSVLPFMPTKVKETVNFFAPIKIKYQEFRWEFGPTFMGTTNFSM